MFSLQMVWSKELPEFESEYFYFNFLDTNNFFYN